MSRRKIAEDALASTDWTTATIEREPRPASVVHSVRFPAELSRKLEAEADRQGVTPSVLVRDLVAAALVAAEQDETVTVRIADLHRAIDLALHTFRMIRRSPGEGLTILSVPTDRELIDEAQRLRRSADETDSEVQQTSTATGAPGTNQGGPADTT